MCNDPHHPFLFTNNHAHMHSITLLTHSKYIIAPRSGIRIKQEKEGFV